MNSKVVLAIVGHGTCGKTTASKYLSSTKRLCYKHSTSEFARKTIKLPGSHENRSNYRVVLGKAIADFNNEDAGIKLYKMMLPDHDIFDGIRRRNELVGIRNWVRDQGKIFIAVWIDRDVPIDPSCEIRPSDCGFSINNRSDLLDFCGNLDLFWYGVNSLQ